MTSVIFPQYTLRERIADGCIHVIGVAASLVALTALLIMGVQAQAYRAWRVTRLVIEHQAIARFARLRFAALAIGGAKAAAIAVVELLEDIAVLHLQARSGDKTRGRVLRAGQRRADETQ